MSKPIDQERELFEAWRLANFCGGHDRLKKCINAPDVYYYTAEQEAWKVWQARASVQPAGVAVPEGFRVMRPTSAALRDGDRWEVYGPSGGGIVSTHDVKDWLVRELLDALAAPHPVSGEQKARPTGLSRGWNLTRQVDGFVIGHSSEEPSEKSKAQAIHDGYIYVPFLVGATPADAQDVAGLVEALEQARLFIRNGIELGVIRMPDADTPDPANDTLPKIDAALANYRDRMGEQPKCKGNCETWIGIRGTGFLQCADCGATDKGEDSVTPGAAVWSVAATRDQQGGQ